MFKFSSGLIITLLPVLAFPLLATPKPYTLIIPAPLDGTKGRNPFVEQLLDKIFTVQGYSLKLQYSAQPSNKIRTAMLVKQNKGVDVLWANANQHNLKQLQPIRFPIYRGYIGWRVLLVNRDQAKNFETIKTLKQLQSYVGVQKHDWVDHNILKINGLDIISDMAFTAMFKAVETAAVDYFPRSVLEVTAEHQKFNKGKLHIEQHLLLRYPSVSYFYVNKNNSALASILNAGFEKIIQSGQYQKHFDQFFGKTLSHLNLRNRHVIDLKNPYF